VPTVRVLIAGTGSQSAVAAEVGTEIGVEVERVATGGGAVAAVVSRVPELAVVEAELADIDGVEVCRRVRASAVDVPVLVLGGPPGATARVDALRAGATDVLTEPWDRAELRARMQAILRRTSIRRRPTVALPSGLVLDPEQRSVRVGSVWVHLTDTEHRLLRVLLAGEGRVLSRAQLLGAVWPSGCRQPKLVDVYVGRLRRKLDPGGTGFVRTVRGVGYGVVAGPGDRSSAS
jgi:DNA-binding response OmpR family regulator